QVTRISTSEGWAFVLAYVPDGGPLASVTELAPDPADPTTPKPVGDVQLVALDRNGVDIATLYLHSANAGTPSVLHFQWSPGSLLHSVWSDDDGRVTSYERRRDGLTVASFTEGVGTGASNDGRFGTWTLGLECGGPGGLYAAATLNEPYGRSERVVNGS